MEVNFGFCLFLLVLLAPLTCAGRAAMSTTAGGGGGGGGDGSIQKLEVQKHLKNLNRPPVKSIKVEIFFFTFSLPCHSFFLSFLFPFYSATFFIDCITVFFFFLIGICKR